MSSSTPEDIQEVLRTILRAPMSTSLLRVLLRSLNQSAYLAHVLFIVASIPHDWPTVEEALQVAYPGVHWFHMLALQARDLEFPPGQLLFAGHLGEPSSAPSQELARMALSLLLPRAAQNPIVTVYGVSELPDPIPFLQESLPVPAPVPATAGPSPASTAPHPPAPPGRSSVARATPAAMAPQTLDEVHRRSATSSMASRRDRSPHAQQDAPLTTKKGRLSSSAGKSQERRSYKRKGDSPSRQASPEVRESSTRSRRLSPEQLHQMEKDERLRGGPQDESGYHKSLRHWGSGYYGYGGPQPIRSCELPPVEPDDASAGWTRATADLRARPVIQENTEAAASQVQLLRTVCNNVRALAGETIVTLARIMCFETGTPLDRRFRGIAHETYIQAFVEMATQTGLLVVDHYHAIHVVHVDPQHRANNRGFQLHFPDGREDTFLSADEVEARVPDLRPYMFMTPLEFQQLLLIMFADGRAKTTALASDHWG